MSDITSHLSKALGIIRSEIQKLNLNKAAASEADTDPNDLTISLAEDDDAGENDGIRIQNEFFSFENAVYSDTWGNDNAYASLDILGYEANGGAYAEIGWEELELGGYTSVSADLIRGEAGIGGGPFDATVAGSVGAEASAEVGIEYDLSEGTVQAEIGGEAFIGAETSVSAGADLGVVGAEAGFEAKAGLGAEFEADMGFEDGKFNASFDVGASLGLGAGFDFDVTVDTGAIVSGAGDAAGWVGDRAGDFGDAITFWD